MTIDVKCELWPYKDEGIPMVDSTHTIVIKSFKFGSLVKLVIGNEETIVDAREMIEALSHCID